MQKKLEINEKKEQEKDEMLKMLGLLYLQSIYGNSGTPIFSMPGFGVPAIHPQYSHPQYSHPQYSIAPFVAAPYSVETLLNDPSQKKYDGIDRKADYLSRLKKGDQKNYDGNYMLPIDPFMQYVLKNGGSVEYSVKYTFSKPAESNGEKSNKYSAESAKYSSK